MVQPSRFTTPGVRPARRINQQAVNKAVEDLLLEGERITTDTVRAKLGSGSFSTISKMLKLWSREKHERIADGAELLGDAGESYLVGRRFTTTGEQETCPVVINGMHFSLDKAEAQKVISAARAIKTDMPESAVMPFDGELLVRLSLAGSVKFTAGREFIEQLANDLERCLPAKPHGG